MTNVDTSPLESKKDNFPWLFSGVKVRWHYCLEEKTFKLTSQQTTYTYPLKVIATVSPALYCLAWDDHPMQFDSDVIYSGPLVPKLNDLGPLDSSEFLFSHVFEWSMDLDGICYRFFPTETSYVVVYLDPSLVTVTQMTTC